MRRTGLVIMISLVFILFSRGTPFGSEVKQRVLDAVDAAPEGSYMPAEVLVKFRAGTKGAQAEGLHRVIGAEVLRSAMGVEGLQLVRLPQGVSVKEAVRRYMEDPAVEYAEPNYIYWPEVTFPDDTYFSQQWSLHNEGQTMNGVPDADMDMPEAWDITTGSRDIIVAVIDTGVDYSHPDLGPNIWINPNEIPDNGIDDDNNNLIDDVVGWDYFDNDNDPSDELYHGTHVAGIIGALGNNSTGIAGVNWQVRIMVLKAGGSEGYLTLDAIVQAIYYAANMGARVINASYGSYQFSQSEYDAISYANSRGVLFVAAAGNDTNDNDLYPHYPSNYDLPNIISVAASDQDDMMAAFSNYGRTTVDVAAPGNHTLSTWPIYVSPLGYETIEGTSMASPHVAGLAALLMDYYRNFDIHQIKATIETFVDRLPQFQEYVATSGRVNAYKAVSSLLTPTSLVAVAPDHTMVDLSWQDNATGEDGYRVERRAEGEASFSLLVNLPADTQTYRDTSVEPQKTYTYRVIAFNSIGESPSYSNEATVTVPAPSTNGGGGCSVVSRKEGGDIGLLLVPAVLFLLKGVSRRRN